MLKLALYGWRNLWRQKRRTILTLISISFGLFLAILVTAIQDRSFSDMIDMAARMGSGHVTVQHEEYLDRPTLSRSLSDTSSVRKWVLKDEQVSKAVVRIRGQAMLATSSDSFGVFFLAYDPAMEDDTTLSFLEGLKEGEMFSTSRDNGIILGDKLAKNLDLRLGEKVVYTLMDKHGEIVANMARLSGIIGTGADSMDGSLCLLPLDTLREVLGYGPKEATSVAVFLSDSRRSVDVAASLAEQVEEGQSLHTWAELQPDLAGFIAMKVGGGVFMELVILLLVAAGIFNTLFVSVMERIREFGIMLAIGYDSAKIFALVMWESLWLSILGILGGLLMVAWPYHALATKGMDISAKMGDQSMDIGGVGMGTILYAGLYPSSFVIIVVAVLCATLFAGLYPAWKASTTEPVDSIKLV